MSTTEGEVRDLLAASRNCAQTSFVVLQRELGLDESAVLRALTPLPGIALRGETCGAVTGCLMAIGLVSGGDRLDDNRGYLASLVPSRESCRRFEEAHGGTSCAKLLEAKLGRAFDLADRRGSLDYVAAGGPEACAAIVANAIGIALQVVRQRSPAGRGDVGGAQVAQAKEAPR